MTIAADGEKWFVASMQKHTAASGSAQDMRKSLHSHCENVEFKAESGMEEDNDGTNKAQHVDVE